MYFEFEEACNNDGAAHFAPDSKSTTSEGDKQTMHHLPLDRSVSSPTSPLAQRKSLFENTFSSLSASSSLLSNQSSSTPASDNHSTNPPPPMSLPSASPISAQRQRRYSIHSSASPVRLDTLQDNGNVTFCDLALITKKKLIQLGSCAKALEEEEVPEPDVKLNPSFIKPCNKDLRREVLLASMQRSLSVSSDDLSLSPSNSRMSEFIESELFKIVNKSYDSHTDDFPMEVVANNGGKAILTSYDKEVPLISTDEIIMGNDFFPSQSDYIKGLRVKARRSLASYTPAENQNNYMSSPSTFTSTTSMAGGCSKNGINHCRGYKKLNVNALNLIGNGIGNNGNGNYYYSSNSATPKLALTMSSSLTTPLKKRLHSSSPSKYSSPYHTISNSVCKDLNSIFANSPLSPDWDVTFKRLKVMHCSADVSSSEGGEAPAAADVAASHTSMAIIAPTANVSSLQQPFTANNGQPEHELNELAQDFHRLKTPFT